MELLSILNPPIKDIFSDPRLTSQALLATWPLFMPATTYAFACVARAPSPAKGVSSL
jgi:hypothetical protein